MNTHTLEISFEGFWQCRLATDPDPAREQRGISGFTYSLAGETLLDNIFFSQAKDIYSVHDAKDENFKISDKAVDFLHIKNIRQASPDYEKYNTNGIGIKVSGVSLDGIPIKNPDRPEGSSNDDTIVEQDQEDISRLYDLVGCLVRFNPYDPETGNYNNWLEHGPRFEGRNQITSDGDPDRFTLNPFVISISQEIHKDEIQVDETMKDETEDINKIDFEIFKKKEKILLRRFDPLDLANPGRSLIDIAPDNLAEFVGLLKRRLPIQRFALSNELLGQVGIDPDNLNSHFENRWQWLGGKASEADASGKYALAQSYKSRQFAIKFFTQSTGPTVLSNRLLSRIPLRQLYKHSIQGVAEQDLNADLFDVCTLDYNKDWDVMYYLGAYDGDLMAGWCTGMLSIPVFLKSDKDQNPAPSK